MEEIISPAMVREALAHIPLTVEGGSPTFEWLANYLNEAIADPTKVCECCGVRPDGVYFDSGGFPVRT